MDAIILAQGACAYAKSDGPQTSALLLMAGLTLHWFRGSDRCAPRCPGCEFNAPDGTWVTRDARNLLNLQESRLRANLRQPDPDTRVDESRAVDANVQVPLPYGMNLRPYQRAAVAYYKNRTNVLVGDEMGLGKSIEAVAMVNATPSASKILVVCPATLKENWRREIEAWDEQAGVVIICDDASDVPDSFSGRTWCICNADRLVAARVKVRVKLRPRCSGRPAQSCGRAISEGSCSCCPFPSPGCSGACSVPISAPQNATARHACCPLTITASDTKSRKQERAGGLWSALMLVQWDVLVIDEAHRLRNPKAARTPRVLGAKQSRANGPDQDGLVQRSRRVVALTGTPIPNRVRELWPLVSCLAPTVFARNGEFLFRYCGAKQEEIFKPGGHGEKIKVWNFDGASHLDELQAKLRDALMIRRTKADVLKELPEKTRKILPLPFDDLKREADAERDGWLKLYPRVDDARTEILLAEAMGDAFAFEDALDRLNTEIGDIDIATIAPERKALALAKIPIVVQRVEDLLAQTAKIVVMAHHHQVVEQYAQAFWERGYQTVRVYGPTSLEDRQYAIDRFQTDPNTRVFVGSLHAAGVGLTLTAANVMLMAEWDWDPSVNIQCEDRIHRISQERAVFIEYPIVDGSIEAVVLACVLRKQRIIDQALDAPARDPDRRKVWPKASDSDRKLAKECLQVWVNLGAASVLRERVAVLVNGMAQRAEKRPLTDGEVWLCKKLARENVRTLPQALRGLLT